MNNTADEASQLGRLRAVEEILLAEYDDAQEELDNLSRSTASPVVEAVMNRYTYALQRLREFLTTCEIPRDVADRLDDWQEVRR